MAIGIQSSPNGHLEVTTPFDANFLEQFKQLIPPASRSWDKAKKVWLVEATQGEKVSQLINSHYGLDVPVPTQASLLTNEPITRRIRLEYLGATKDRPGEKEKTAFGFADGGWSVILPESVLRAFFAADGSGTETLYSLLGITELAELDEIKSGHRRAARSWHPDICKEDNAAEMFQKIQQAWEILREPQTKKKYDAGLYFERSLTNQTLKHSRWENYVSPYRCGVLNVTGTYRLNVLQVSEIHSWKEITNSDGAVLVTSWPKGADHFVSEWVPF